MSGGGGGLPAGVTQGQWYADSNSTITIYLNSSQTTVLSFAQSVKPQYKLKATMNTTYQYVSGGIVFDALPVGTGFQYSYFILYVASQEMSGSLNVYNATFGFDPTVSTAGTYPSGDTGGTYQSSFTIYAVLPTVTVKRVGPWVAFYINNIPVLFPTYYTDLGIPSVTPPVGMGSEWYFYVPPSTSSIQVSSNVGLYASLTGSPPGYSDIQFSNISVEELTYQKSLENMIKDASSLGGVMEQSLEQVFTDNFTNLNNWQ